jgi:transcription termination factor Rho
MTEEDLEELPAAKLRAAKKATPVKKAAVKKAPARKAAPKKEVAVKVAAPAAGKIVRKKAPAKAQPEIVSKVETAPEPEAEPAPKKKAPARKKAAAKATDGEDRPTAPDDAPNEPRTETPPDGKESPKTAGPVAGAPPAQSQPQPGPAGESADAQSRKLTKWERWKMRKEKFKEMRRQRWLEKQTGRQGGGPPAGENGNSPAPEGPEHGNNGERSPRPEIPLGPPEDCAGLLELTPGKGFGFLRPRERNFAPLPTDPFVTPEMVRNLGLRDGLWIEAVMRRGGRGPQVIEIKNVNGRAPDTYRFLPLFEELTAINPNKRYILETDARRYTTRLIDFIAPIGRGQRGLIVAPPRAGKTTILQHIAEAVKQNYPDVKLMIVLVDERPEEVTEISRAVTGADIMASNNDRDPRDHIRIAALAMERARRLVEAGEHVFMVLDSITRLARAFNNAIRGHGGGKGSLSGGVDARALEGARRMFASARNTREAGSLTIIGTALIETNSRADDLIFQEFKGTGNMELMLDRKIAQQYIYPAVDIFKSGTRREELLLPPHQMEKVHVIRRGLAGHKPVEAMERLLHFMERFNNNAQLLVEIKSRE